MIEFAATVFVTLVVIIDPVGTLPIFLALTHSQKVERRRRTAATAVAVAAATLLVVALVGGALLHFLGIGLPALRIAGGLLLLLLSIDMVFARQSGIRSTTRAETREASESEDVAVFPLAIPLIAGPGAIASVILLMQRTEHDLALQAVVIALLLSVLGLCLAVLLFAAPLMERLGRTGINVIGRVFGIVLAALAVQYVIDGTKDALAGVAIAPGRGSAAAHGTPPEAVCLLAPVPIVDCHA
jgi:multiple antibiotic resistance protein